MQVITQLFDTVFFAPITNLLVLILRAFESFHIPGSMGFSIIILTILIRMLIWPLMSSQLKSAKKIGELKPHLDKLKEKHKEDKQALAKAQMALYKEHGVNPAGGCLPSLLQLPIIIALYQVILALFDPAQGLTRINNLLYLNSWKLNTSVDPNFLGLNLSQKPSDFTQAGAGLLLVPIITALLTLAQSKMMVHKPVRQYPSDSPKEKEEKKTDEDMMSAMQSQMMYLMPVMIGYFAFQFPVGLAIYWNTFTALGIIQQYKISGWGGLWKQKYQKY